MFVSLYPLCLKSQTEISQLWEGVVFLFWIKQRWQYHTVGFSLQNPSKEKVYLSGYGVELAIKSTEYKAKDDTQVKGEFLFEVF